MQNLTKKSTSFFGEIFTTWKGLVILGYMLVCGCLYRQFADDELVSDLVQDFTPENVISHFSLDLVWHVVLVGAALALLFILIYALGTCLYSRSRIKINLPSATLPTDKSIAHPALILYIPHRRKGYIEMEFYSSGVEKARWEEMKSKVEFELDITIISEITSRKGKIICFHAATDSIKPKVGNLYDNENE